MRIGFFGGSFDPPHIGHEAIVSWVFANTPLEQIWVVPCFQHPFDKSLASFSDRIAMCHLAFDRFDSKVVVSEIERELGGISFTSRTMRVLKEEMAEAQWSLIVGEDAYQERTHWNESAWLEKNVDWVVVPRGSSSPIPNVSGTEIRRAVCEGREWKDQVLPAVAEYYQKRRPA